MARSSNEGSSARHLRGAQSAAPDKSQATCVNNKQPRARRPACGSLKPAHPLLRPVLPDSAGISQMRCPVLFAPRRPAAAPAGQQSGDPGVLHQAAKIALHIASRRRSDPPSRSFGTVRRALSCHDHQQYECRGIAAHSAAVASSASCLLELSFLALCVLICVTVLHLRTQWHSSQSWCMPFVCACLLECRQKFEAPQREQLIVMSVLCSCSLDDMAAIC